MNQPATFREDRTEVLHRLMRAHPLAVVVSHATDALTADHVPLAVQADGTLHGHIALANPLAACVDPTVLCVFQGPQSYVTPSWYASKAEHGKVVPTWNYVTVHAHGTLRFTRDPDWLMAHLHDLTDRQESHRALPWSVADAPSDFTQRMLRGLIGFEIAVTKLDGVWKVSQNKAPADRAGVARGLMDDSLDDGATAIAALIRDRSAPPGG